MTLARKAPKMKSTILASKTDKNKATCMILKPIELGTIRRHGAYWFTVDGRKHVSAQEASKYLVKLNELVEFKPVKLPEVPESEYLKEPKKRPDMAQRHKDKTWFSRDGKGGAQNDKSLQEDPDYQAFLQFKKFRELEQQSKQDGAGAEFKKQIKEDKQNIRSAKSK